MDRQNLPEKFSVDKNTPTKSPQQNPPPPDKISKRQNLLWQISLDKIPERQNLPKQSPAPQTGINTSLQYNEFE